MAKKSTIVDPADGTVIYPQTLVGCVQDESGALLENLVLMKDNTTEFTPTDNYQPATKGYVDSKVSTEISNVNTTLSNVNTTLNDKQTKITASGLLKGNGSGGVSAATAGADYAPGGYGFGTDCINISGTDILSVYRPNGFYMGQQMTNAPYSSANWFYFLIMNNSASYRKIIALDVFSNIICSNTSKNGAWVGWVQIYPAVYSS